MTTYFTNKRMQGFSSEKCKSLSKKWNKQFPNLSTIIIMNNCIGVSQSKNTIQELVDHGFVRIIKPSNLLNHT